MKRINGTDWAHPKGRWCMVAPCSKCGRFCSDTSYESLFSRAKWGTKLSAPTRTIRFWTDDGMCGDCLRFRRCCLCGKEGTATTIYTRTGIGGWDLESRIEIYTKKTKDCICMACWNKVRAIVRKQDEADECRRFLKKLARSISDERKNQDDRRTA